MTLWWSFYINPKGLGSESLSVGKHMEIQGEWYTWQGHESPALLPRVLPYALFHLNVPEFHPFIINWLSSNKIFDSVRCSSKLSKSKGHGNLLFIVSQKYRWQPGLVVGIWVGGGCWDLQFAAGWSEAQAITRACSALKWAVGLWKWALDLKNLILSPVGSVRMELNSWTPAGVWSIVYGRGELPPHIETSDQNTKDSH